MEYINGQPFLPGAGALIEQLDKEIMLILRDGRHLVGTLRNFDHFLNLTLEKTSERVILKDKYCDIPLGLYIVRGDNVVILGELQDEDSDSTLSRISPEELALLEDNALDDSPLEKVNWDLQDS